MPTALTITVGILLGAIGLTLAEGKRRLESIKLAEREALSTDEIYSRYYAHLHLQKSDVVELWNEVADTLKVSASRMRPGDRFGVDIGTFVLTSDHLDVLGVVAQQRANKQGMRIDLSSLSSIDDYIKMFSRAAPELATTD